MPIPVRRALWLIATTQALVVIARISAGATIQAMLITVITAGLLFGIARRYNWARLTFAVVFLGALPFSIVALVRHASVAPIGVALALLMTVLQAIGVAFLLLPQAAAWYHHSGGAA